MATSAPAAANPISPIPIGIIMNINAANTNAGIMDFGCIA